MIEVKSLTKIFPPEEKPAVNEINFKVNRGEIVGLLGENGAGKTTTLRLLSTVLTPTSGTAVINGYDIVNEPKKVREQLGVVTGSDTGLYERLTARENIQYYSDLLNIPQHESAEKIETCLNI